MNRDTVVHTARKVMERRWPDLASKSGGCLYMAACTVYALQSEGVRGVIQAGSCHWPRLTPEQAAKESDPIRAFGYEWEPNSLDTRLRLSQGLLPEMHVWVAIPSLNEIVDLTSNQFPAQCQSIIGMDWPGILPPDYFWCKTDLSLWPENVRYEANVKAIDVALMLLDWSMKSRR